MIDGSAAAPPLLLLQQETKLTGIDVVVALKMKKSRMEHKGVGSLAIIGEKAEFSTLHPPQEEVAENFRFLSGMSGFTTQAGG
jgi:hypothetical protein